jgi:ketosteroid isomerase-like protein
VSQHDVDVVRRVLAAFNDRDWAAWESHHHPEFEWVDPEGFPGGGVHRGLGDVRRFLDDVLEAADEWQVEVDVIDSVGTNRVLMRGRSVVVGRVSGISIDDPLFQLFELEDGRVRRVRTFRSRDEALEATGS